MPASVALYIDEDKVFRLARRGLSQTMIAKALGVARSTFQEYLKTQPSVRAAYENGRANDVQDVVDALKESATKKNNVIAQIFYLKNKDPDNWKDKHDVQHSGNLTVNVGAFGDASAIEGQFEEVTDENEGFKRDTPQLSESED